MNTKYRDALIEAKRELYELLSQHEQAEKRISKLKLTIAGLKQLCGDESVITEEPGELTFAHVSGMGLTNIIREILKRSDSPLSAIDVREKMTTLGLPIEDYRNALATIHIILRRLQGKGEIQPVESDSQKESTEPTAYFYIPTSEQRIARPASPTATRPAASTRYVEQRISRMQHDKKEEKRTAVKKP